MDKAETIDKEALETYTRQFGIEHEDTIRSMKNMASNFLLQGRFTEAETMLMEILCAQRRMRNRKDSPTMNSVDDDVKDEAHTIQFEDCDFQIIDELTRDCDLEAQFWGTDYPMYTEAHQALVSWRNGCATETDIQKE